MHLPPANAEVVRAALSAAFHRRRLPPPAHSPTHNKHAHNTHNNNNKPKQKQALAHVFDIGVVGLDQAAVNFERVSAATELRVPPELLVEQVCLCCVAVLLLCRCAVLVLLPDRAPHGQCVFGWCAPRA